MADVRAFHFVIAVWGKDYVDIFLRVALPSFLAPGNLPACSSLGHVELLVYTRPEDQSMIESHPCWQAATKLVSATINPVITSVVLQQPNRYGVMSFCHREAIARAVNDGAIISILSPDCVIADGGLSAAARKVLGSYKAVLIAGPRGTLEVIAPNLLSRAQRSGTVIAITNRDLIRLMANHPHPISQRLFWGKTDFSHVPSALYWRAGSSSILAKYFHLHPLFVDLRGTPHSAADDAGTVDGPFMRLCGITEKDIYFVTNSDEIALIELSRQAHDWMGGSWATSPTWRVLDWMMLTTEVDHRQRFLCHDIRFVGEPDIDWPRELRRMRQDIFMLRLLIPLFTAHPSLHMLCRQLPTAFSSVQRRLRSWRSRFVRR